MCSSDLDELAGLILALDILDVFAVLLVDQILAVALILLLTDAAFFLIPMFLGILDRTFGHKSAALAGVFAAKAASVVTVAAKALPGSPALTLSVAPVVVKTPLTVSARSVIPVIVISSLTVSARSVIPVIVSARSVASVIVVVPLTVSARSVISVIITSVIVTSVISVIAAVVPARSVISVVVLAIAPLNRQIGRAHV